LFPLIDNDDDDDDDDDDFNFPDDDDDDVMRLGLRERPFLKEDGDINDFFSLSLSLSSFLCS